MKIERITLFFGDGSNVILYKTEHLERYRLETVTAMTVEQTMSTKEFEEFKKDRV